MNNVGTVEWLIQRSLQLLFTSIGLFFKIFLWKVESCLASFDIFIRIVTGVFRISRIQILSRHLIEGRRQVGQIILLWNYETELLYKKVI